MPIEIRRFPNEPILLIQAIGATDPEAQRSQTLEAVIQLKREMGGHIFRIIDMSQAVFDFGQIVIGMADERDQAGGMNDPDVSTLMVASDAIIRIAVNSVKTEQYGSVRTDMFPTVEAALAHARAQIAKV